MKILRINASDTYPLRSKVLYPDLPQSMAKYEGDDDEQTFHLGAFMDSKLVSIASFYFIKNDTLNDPYQYRLRGMATLSNYQHKGLSSELLKMAFPIIKQNFCSIVWCNARTPAAGFYEKVGFEKVGQEYQIPKIGPHVLMFKRVADGGSQALS